MATIIEHHCVIFHSNTINFQIKKSRLESPAVIGEKGEKFWRNDMCLYLELDLGLKGYRKVELVIFCETTFYKQHDMII